MAINTLDIAQGFTTAAAGHDHFYHDSDLRYMNIYDYLWGEPLP